MSAKAINKDLFKQHAWKPMALAVFMWLMYQLWFDQTSIMANLSMREQIENQREINIAKQARNQVLLEEVRALKAGMDSIESKARKELGMVKKDETYFIIVEHKKGSQK